MSKHTQGPWTLETVQTSCGVCHKIGPFPWKDGKQNHACIYADYPGTGPIEKESLANARLIAAAPDLLNALVDLYALVNGECPSLLEDDHHDETVRAAILKATQP